MKIGLGDGEIVNSRCQTPKCHQRPAAWPPNSRLLPQLVLAAAAVLSFPASEAVHAVPIRMSMPMNGVRG